MYIYEQKSCYKETKYFTKAGIKYIYIIILCEPPDCG